MRLLFEERDHGPVKANPDSSFIQLKFSSDRSQTRNEESRRGLWNDLIRIEQTLGNIVDEPVDTFE